MVDANKRISHYLARMDADLLATEVLAVNSLQMANFADYVREFYPYQCSASQVLDNFGVAVTTRIFYQAFNSIMYRAWKSSSGSSLALEALRIVELFVSRGLDRSVLETIASDVWATGTMTLQIDPIAVSEIIVSVHGLTPKALKGTVQNLGTRSAAALVDLMVQDNTSGVWVTLFTDSQTTGVLYPGAAPHLCTSLTNWTPAAPGTHFRTAITAHAVGQSGNIHAQVVGAGFSVIVP